LNFPGFFKREKSVSLALLVIVFVLPCPCLSLSLISSHILNLCNYSLCTNSKHNNNTHPTHPYPHTQTCTPTSTHQRYTTLKNCANLQCQNTHSHPHTQDALRSKIVSIHIMYCKLKGSKQVSTCYTRCVKIK
jgi:hypothetical protein